MDIQWFPGHMMKTRRMMQENQRLVDVIAELVDARIPQSSRNPAIDEIFGTKPRLLVMNKADIADEAANREWESYFNSQGIKTVCMSSTGAKSPDGVLNACRALIADKLQHDRERGLVNRPVKIMVVGIPNVGKSTFINKLSRRKSAATGDRPGVTRGKQWIRLKNGFELLDTPGILWPKFEDPLIGEKLAFTGAVKDEIMDIEELGAALIKFLNTNYPSSLAERYKLDASPDLEGYELLTLMGKKRGFVISGGEVDTERAARILLDEFRGAKLGKITLERPEDFKQ